MRKKRSAAYGGEADRESCRAQAHDWGAGRKRRREADIRPDPSGCRANRRGGPALGGTGASAGWARTLAGTTPSDDQCVTVSNRKGF